MKERTRRKVFDEQGHAHLLTFTCYKRRRFFSNDAACKLFLECLDAARKRHGFQVWAYVVMPEHVHILVWPGPDGVMVAVILQSIKQPVSARLKLLMPPNLPGGKFRLWERGGGHDRNLWSKDSLSNALEYIHNNPVQRGLTQTTEAYEWSSANWYARRTGPFDIDNIAEVDFDER